MARAEARHTNKQAAYVGQLERRRENGTTQWAQEGRNASEDFAAGSPPKDPISFTDSDSRIVRSSVEFEQACNAQASVDHVNQTITDSPATCLQSNSFAAKREVDGWIMETVVLFDFKPELRMGCGSAQCPFVRPWPYCKVQ